MKYEKTYSLHNIIKPRLAYVGMDNRYLPG